MKLERFALVALLCAFCVALTGCGKQRPAQNDIRAAIAKIVPSTLVLKSVDSEVIETSVGDYTVKFKAIATARENLCKQVEELLNEVALLEVVYPKGAEIVFYGEVRAHKQVDRWDFGMIRLEQNLRDLPRPQSSFPPGSLIAGTREGDKALAEYRADLERREKELIEAVARSQQRAKEERAKRKAEQEAEQARIQAEKEAEQKRFAAERARLLSETEKALAAGSIFQGVMTVGFNTQNIELRVISLKDAHLVVDLSNPDVDGVVRRFSGSINIDAKPPREHPVALTPMSSPTYPRATWNIYRYGTELRLDITPQGLLGNGRAGGDNYQLKLIRQ